ncbi:phage protease [Aneurinibacillus sp. Ricciae_BoGa-3]|uniref:phage protease n=1 Tax=Aneurinibacillus sp. Ricciae_BoGa-3 TaxID=3022697 RepID=UPI0023414AB4|nr:phage protease [Aneurinibacillus sp. Ricciae_BoGa-3]WCK53845.1 phage protease [Aneurinibacillus sp. Ricciae_BoGa-3]
MGVLKIPFFRLGEWKHPVYGKLEGTQQMFSQMIDNFRQNKLGRPPYVRIGHDKGNETTFGGVEALGWVQDLVEEDGVLYGLADPTTPQAEEFVRDKRYRFASAEYNSNYTDKETGLSIGPVLTAISLTNEPFLTRLPEAVVLSEQPDLFIMDYQLADPPQKKEDEPKMGDESKGILTKLSDMFAGFMKKTEEVQTATQTQLAEVNKRMEEQVKLAQQQASFFETQAKEAEAKRLLAETDKAAADMVAQGIPPVMVEQWKQLAFSDQGKAMVKLADNKEVSTAESMKQMLLAMPKESRIPMGQAGSQSTVTEAEKVALAAREDIMALGGKVSEDGKFII